MTAVLVVDDDRPLARALAINLRAHGYQVTLAHTAATALTEVTRTHPAVVVLDLGLPDLDGIEVLTGIRCWSAVPVIVLSARSTSAEKVAGTGRRCRRLRHQTLRHGRTPGPDPGLGAPRQHRPPTDEPDVVTTADFTVDFAAHQVRRGGTAVRLTPTEWSLLEILVRHNGKLVPQKQLLTEIWGPDDRTTNPLPAGLPRPAPPQTRTRPRPPPVPDHRTGRRIPVPVMTRPQHTNGQVRRHRPAPGRPRLQRRTRHRR